MSVQKVGIEGIKKVNDYLVKGILLGEKIAKDGVDASDIKYLAETEAYIKEGYELFQSKPDLANELGDIDFAEGVELAKIAYDDYKKIVA